MANIQASADALQARIAYSPSRADDVTGRQTAPSMTFATAGNLESTGPCGMQIVRGQELTVTSRRGDGCAPFRVVRLCSDNTCMVLLQMAPLSSHELWLEGRLASSGQYPAFGVVVFRPRQEARLVLPADFHCVEFCLQLKAPADIPNAYSVGLSAPCHGMVDLLLGHLAMALLSGLTKGRESGDSVTEHLLGAIASYISQAYGEMATAHVSPQGGLAPWQIRRCEEIIRAKLSAGVTIQRMASECRLSRSHFTRQFRSAKGQSPHRWLLENRVAAAKALLTNSKLPIAEIALQTGFADQSHMTRTFTTIAGTSPGVWRRSQ